MLLTLIGLTTKHAVCRKTSVITNLLITNNYLFEMIRKNHFINYISEFIQVLKGLAEEVFSIRHNI